MAHYKEGGHQKDLEPAGFFVLPNPLLPLVEFLTWSNCIAARCVNEADWEREAIESARRAAKREPETAGV